MNIHDEINACMDCIQLIANGEVPAEATEEENEAWLARIEERWGENQQHACVAGEENEEAHFSWSPCGYCGCKLGGDRYPVVILCSHAECKV